MKFIHTADLHLDSPFLGLKNHSLPDDLWEKIHQSTFDSFQKIIDEAINDQVDFVLLVGDLFDREERSVAADAFLMAQLNRLKDHEIDAFISFGNHDYSTADPSSFGYPDNTHVFSNQVETKKYRLENGQVVAISGFSFDKQWITDPMIQDYPQAFSDATWNIGMLHGSLSTLNSPEANYAPFTLNQLEEKGYDYWALGHIHKRQALNKQGTINYSGNTQGRHINETGEKGFLLVESDGGQLTSHFQSTAPIIWDFMAVSVAQQPVKQLAELIMSQLADQHFDQLHLLRLQLKSDQQLDSELLGQIASGELLDAIQQINRDKWRQLNCWVTSLEAPVEKNVVYSAIDQTYFNQARDETLTDDAYNQILKAFDKQPAFIKDELNQTDIKQSVFDTASAILRENVVNEYDKEDGDK
ncbi:DNA repair exonuclease [Lentilactobacillus parabuchneri]|uniref:metallophosphoesterase family protein n=1 Tax=Lentilactobacillus parabuchneri TaxID=152331 RepID=UPI0018660105|nr:DNA repair exonuclease [Lentilactobacillus parabuchneri]QOP51405.1 DNA repair exonuclease [Lentilactobacillus parabuchneri]